MPPPPTTQGNRLTVSPIQVAASALASVSAAIVASYFNVTGTIIGTVLVSVIATTSAAIYSSSIRRAHARIRHAATQRPLLRSPQDRRYPSAPTKRAGSPVLEGLAGLGAPDSVAGSRRRPPHQRNWHNIRVPVVGAAVAALVIAIASLTIIELVAQKPLSAVVRGQSGSGQSFFGGADHGNTAPSKSPSTTTTTRASPDTTTTTTNGRGPDSSTSTTTSTTIAAPTTTTTTAAPNASPETTTTTTK